MYDAGMAYPLEFLRLVAIGTIYASETFSFSMSLIHAGGPTPSAPDEVPEEIVDAFAEYFATTGLISSQARLTTLKLNLIGTNGRYVGDETVLYDYDPYVAGQVGQFVAPQVAYAVTLRTAKARGRAHAGRFYLPMPALNLDATGQISDLELQPVVVPTRDLVESINAALVPWRVGVTSNLGAGAQEPVTHLAFGRVLDTIRSRRTSIAEDYYEDEPLDVT